LVKVNKNKRKLLRYGLAGAGFLAAGAAWRYLGAEPETQAAPREIGVVGHKLPTIHADYWINPAGEETNFSMAEVRGKWVFLKCFQNWCPGCHKHGFPTLKKVSDAFAEHPMVSILGVQTVFEGALFNRQSAVRELQLEYDLPIKMGHDPGVDEYDGRPRTMMNFRTGGTPWIVIANPAGQVVFNNYHLDADKFIDYLSARLPS